MNLERHLKMGPYLNITHERLIQLSAEVANTEGKNSEIAKEFDKIIEDFGKLRSHLENCMFEHYPDELKQLSKMGYDPLRIYYGSTHGV